MTRFLFALVAWFPILSYSAEIHVNHGKDALTAAIAAAQPGDTLLLGAGVYHEQVRIEKPLTIRGEKGARLDGSTPLKAEWQPTDGMEGVFTTPLKKRAYGLLLDGKFIAEIRMDRAEKDGDWHWRTLLKKGTPLSGFGQVRALWMYHPKEQRVYLRPPDGVTPDKAALSVVISYEPLIEIAGAKDVLIQDLELAGGVDAIKIRDSAKAARIYRCRVLSYEGTGIMITRGASDCVVEGCEVTRGAFEEWSPSLKHSRENYEIWRIHKDVGKYDRVGIDLIEAGARNRILNNTITRVFDGVCIGDYKCESLDKPLTDPDHGRGTEIAGNVITDTRDSGIELGVGCVDVHVHHNVLQRTHGGLRFKVPRTGPVFIHHNRLITGAPFHIWFSMDASPAEGYVYHNTIVGGSNPALYYNPFNKARDFASPNWHFLNNLVLTGEGFFDQSSKTPPPDFTAAHNLTTGDRRPWPKDKSKDRGSLYNVKIQHDEKGTPAPGSAAQDAGLDLSTYRKGGPLPGCEPGYFKGKAPDIGADER
jgi:hypothetical protein